MTRLKALTTAALAAATIGFVAAPSASAQPMSCNQAMRMYEVYMAHGNVWFALGNTSAASAYYGRARGVLEGAC